MKTIRYPKDCETRSQLGGKAAALAALHPTDIAIPAWFALTPAAAEPPTCPTDRSLTLTPAAQVELRQALSRLCPNDEPVAVRSSALDEDGATHSFAGQLASFLNVTPADVADSVIDVWRSAHSEHLRAYRREHALDSAPPLPAVLIQRMVHPEVAGVAFSADPVSARRGVVVVSAVAGLGEALVSGAANADTYHVDRHNAIIERRLVARHPLLDDAQIRGIADLARQTERHFGCPQDIEWAIVGGQLYLLQSRPITGLAERSDPDGCLNLWDNSNIAESYPGITTPLTFSFARRAYEAVYCQFCRLMGVREQTIIDHADTFRRMLGLIDGRIYYNLLNWYRVLTLLPGFTVNRGFMEQMMGVKESLPPDLLAETAKVGLVDQVWDGLRLARSLLHLIAAYHRLPHQTEQFQRRLSRALGADRPDLDRLRPTELLAHYRDLEQQLLTRWDAPLVNDFFVMIFCGLLGKLTAAWCDDQGGQLQRRLLCDLGDVISTEPAKRLRRMAQSIVGDAPFSALLRHGSLKDIRLAMQERSQFAAQWTTYLTKFGDRCLEELKLESPTVDENPLNVLRAVGQLAQQPRITNGASPDHGESPAVQAEAEALVPLASHPMRRLVFGWVLKNARRLVRNRENLRFERTRVFGRARQIFLALGRQLYGRGHLASARDVFYLEVDEISRFIDGTATTADLKSLVTLRRAEFERYRAGQSPPDRFETRGMVGGGGYRADGATLSTAISNGSADGRETGEVERGLGCSPGVVRGVVRVVKDPRTTTLQPGEILVAERTDPGWIVHFTNAAGVLVAHGSMLSHAAIVARELGLPAVTALSGITQRLKDGDLVEIDGSAGLVRKLGGIEQRPCQSADLGTPILDATMEHGLSDFP